MSAVSVDPVPAEGDAVDVRLERSRTPLGSDAFLSTHYLNAAGAAVPSSATLAAIVDHLKLEVELGGYEAAAVAGGRLEGVYTMAASLIGAAPEEIALAENATFGFQLFVNALRLGPGDRVIAARSTYVNAALQLLELSRSGVEVEIVPDLPTGGIDLEALALALRRPAALLTVAHVPTSSGTVEPVQEIGRLAGASGTPYMIDATQSAGHIPLDVAALGCDAMVMTGRKFLRGPRGTGLLYVSSAMCERLRPAAPDVRGSRWSGEREFEIVSLARRFESFETSYALRLGLGVAIAEALALGVDRIGAHSVRLAARARERLREEIPAIRITDLGETASAIVTFVRTDEEPAETLARLKAAACQVVSVPAHHGVWDMAPRGLEAVIRASFHVYNDEDDVEALVEAVAGGGRSLTRGVTPSSTVPAAGGAVAEPAKPQAVVGGSRSGGAPDADVIVVGAGVHGRATAWQLARRGAEVILLERFRAGHVEGSSHGATRMIRRAYPSEVWDGLVDLAYSAWAELEELSGTELITTTGGVYAHPLGQSTLRGPGCEPIDTAALRSLAPALTLDERFSVVHDPAAGVIDAAAAMERMLTLGVGAGVKLIDSSPVYRVDPADDGSGVTVITPAASLRAPKVVVCAGPWIGSLVPELADRVRVERIVNVHFQSADPDAVAAPNLPVFSVQTPDAGLVYGIPGIGGRGLKVGIDHGPVEDPARRSPPVTEDEIEAVRALVRRYVPLGDGTVQSSLSCRYTRTANQRFGIGPLPDRPDVLVAAACSGHGFKFGPAIGAALADMVEGRPRPDLAFLDPARLPPLA